jgi:hypothetical protein
MAKMERIKVNEKQLAHLSMALGLELCDKMKCSITDGMLLIHKKLEEIVEVEEAGE